MKNIFKIKFVAAVCAGSLLLASCNKDVEQLAPIATPTYPSGAGVAGAIAAIPGDSLYNRLLIKSGLAPMFNNNASTYTLFATDNNGIKIFAKSLYPLLDTSSNSAVSIFISTQVPTATAAGIILYNTIGGKYPSSAIPETFPNYPLPSQIVLDPNLPFARLPIFPSKRGSNLWVNNIPVTSVDLAASNGIIHHTYTIVAPPQATLRQMIANESTLSYYRAAIARADSGQLVKANNDSTNFFNYLLGYGVTNMTVLTPNDAAFQNLVFAMVYGKVYAAVYAAQIAGGASVPAAQAAANAAATPPANAAVAAGPAFLATNNVTTAQIRGIMAYHFLASGTTSITPNIRVFGVNLSPYSPSPTAVKTLVNSSIAAHPGILAGASFFGPFANSITFLGYGSLPPAATPYNGPAAISSALAGQLDKHAANGVYHIIDRVLLPQ